MHVGRNLRGLLSLPTTPRGLNAREGSAESLNSTFLAAIKHVGQSQLRQGRTRLQWGRGNCPAESFARHRMNNAVLSASMGPRELPRGETAGKDRHLNSKPKLQWGRGNYPAERALLAGQTRIALTLQWGRGNYPAESRRRRERWALAFTTLQWGRGNYPAERTLHDG